MSMAISKSITGHLRLGSAIRHCRRFMGWSGCAAARLPDQLPGPLFGFHENDGAFIDAVGCVGFEVVDALRTHDFLRLPQCGSKGITEGLGTGLGAAQRQWSGLGKDLRSVVRIRGEAIRATLAVRGFVPFGELRRERLDGIR